MKVFELIRWLEQFDIESQVTLTTIQSGAFRAHSPVLFVCDTKTGISDELTEKDF
jgi:hypothetical protein